MGAAAAVPVQVGVRVQRCGSGGFASVDLYRVTSLTRYRNLTTWTRWMRWAMWAGQPQSPHEAAGTAA